MSQNSAIELDKEDSSLTDPRIDQALAALSNNNPKRCLEILDSMGSRGPLFHRYHHTKGLSLIRLNRFQEASSAFAEELYAHPFSFDVRELLLNNVRQLAPNWTNPIEKERYLTGSRFSFPQISVVVLVGKELTDLPSCIESILIQAYPNLEIILASYFHPKENFRDFLSKLGQGVGIVSVPQTAGPAGALQLGLNCARGEILGWIETKNRYARNGFFVAAGAFIGRPDIELMTGARIEIERLGTTSLALCHDQRWSRRLLLDPDMLINPIHLPRPEATFFKRSLYSRAGSSIDGSFYKAYDYELWARFTRQTAFNTVKAGVGGPVQRDELTLYQSLYEAGYSAEGLSVIAGEKNLEAGPFSNEFAPLITFEHKVANAAPKKIKTGDKIDFPDTPAYLITKGPNSLSLSIVTPSFNQGDFLEQCIDSVLSQGGPNVEYVIMDGGSTDNSVKIIKKYEKYLKYWQSQPDGGQYAAINDGFKQTTDGAVMAWLNADDKYHPDAFKAVTQVFSKDPATQWIIGRPNAYDRSGRITWQIKETPVYSRGKYLNKKYHIPWIQQESVFWRRALWEKAGSFISTEWLLASDTELWARFFRFAQLQFVDAYLGGFRGHGDNKSSLYLKKYLVEADKIIDREVELYKAGQFTQMLPAPAPILKI